MTSSCCFDFSVLSVTVGNGPLWLWYILRCDAVPPTQSLLLHGQPSPPSLAVVWVVNSIPVRAPSATFPQQNKGTPIPKPQSCDGNFEVARHAENLRESRAPTGPACCTSNPTKTTIVKRSEPLVRSKETTGGESRAYRASVRLL